MPLERLEALVGPIELPPLPAPGAGPGPDARPGQAPETEAEAAAAQEPGSVPESPGQLPQHYAPRTPLELLPSAGSAARHVRRAPGERVGLLAFTPPADADRFAAVEVLSERGDLGVAAQRLFGALRQLDRLGLDRIVAEPCPETGLGRAIMDRLRRAAARG